MAVPTPIQNGQQETDSPDKRGVIIKILPREAGWRDCEVNCYPGTTFCGMMGSTSYYCWTSNNLRTGKQCRCFPDPGPGHDDMMWRRNKWPPKDGSWQWGLDTPRPRPGYVTPEPMM